MVAAGVARCASARAARRARLPGGRRRHRRPAGARQPLDASGQRDGRARGPALQPAIAAARRSADASRPTRRAAGRDPSRTARRGHATAPRAAGPAGGLLHRGRAGRAAVGAVHDRPAIRIAWGSGSTGRALTHARGADIISDATPLGVLQVPASGQPILLMADRQTTGGYPKIATVIRADIGRRRAARPGRYDRVRGVHAARGDGGADRAGTRADGRRGAAARDASSSSALMQDGVRRRSRCGRTCRWRRSRPSGSAARPTGSSRRGAATRLWRRCDWRARAGVPVTMLGGGSNVLVADRGVRGLVIRPRGGEVRARWRRQRARRRGGDDQRAGALDDQSRLRRPRGVGRHAGHGRRRGFRQRAFRRPADRRSGHRRAARLPRRNASQTSRPIGDGVRLRSQPPAGHRRGAAVGGVSRVARRSARRCARRRARRWRFASGRSRSTRRAPAASFRIPSRAATPCRTACRGRPARWSIAPG